MVKFIENKYFKYIIIAICFLVAVFQIDKYSFMEYFREAENIASCYETHKNFILPTLNGELYTGAGTLYYIVIKFFAFIFGKYTEFSVRLPSLFCALFTLCGTYILIKQMINKRFAMIASLTL
ncbi:glycosyltransferase family 39 protein, partial [bacterium]|nr:glycosyltransferase family 39 protein [bacterium]